MPFVLVYGTTEQKQEIVSVDTFNSTRRGVTNKIFFSVEAFKI